MQCPTIYCLSPLQFSPIKPPISVIKLPISQATVQSLRRPKDVSFNGGGDDDSQEVTLPLPYHVKSITSPSNPFVKHCLKLRHSSSYRHSHGSVLVVGTTPIREICRFQKAMQERPTAADCLLVLDKAEIPLELDDQSIRVVHASSMVMKKLSGVQSSESIEAIALMRIPSTFHSVDDNRNEEYFRSWFPSPRRVLVLDGIQDPGNLGTLLRSAMAFSWVPVTHVILLQIHPKLTSSYTLAYIHCCISLSHIYSCSKVICAHAHQDGVFLLPGCCDPFNDKALRASRGASFQLPIVSGSWIHLEALINEFQMKILAGHPEGTEELKPVTLLSQGLADSLADTKLCLVLGSEGNGLSERSKQVSELVSIPMAGEFESLNVSVAGGIFLYMLQLANHRFA